MKPAIAAIACLAGVLASSLLAESSDSEWIGVWEGRLDGQPSVTLTLARDTGQLSGTLVLNIIKKEDGGQPHVAAVEPHALINPRVDGNSLSFGVRKIDQSTLLNFIVALTPEGKARIHCTNCGKDAPTVDMDRAW